MYDDNYAIVTNEVSLSFFEEVKHFILERGNRKTFRNFDNANPHFRFDGFSMYLGADIGQKNINNDPEKSDFNQMIIKDNTSDITYLHLLIVRDQDVEKEKAWLKPGMKNGEVYLVDSYHDGIKKLRDLLPNYLKVVKATLRSNR